MAGQDNSHCKWPCLMARFMVFGHVNDYCRVHGRPISSKSMHVFILTKSEVRHGNTLQNVSLQDTVCP